MTRKLFVLFVMLIAVAVQSHSQVNSPNKALGMYFDINEIPIDNYIDFDYSPKDAFYITFKTDGEFVPGVYYDLNGEKISCNIKQSNLSTNVYYKSGGLETLLSPSNCSGYVVGLDSFIVINNFQIDRALVKQTIKEPNWAQVITKTKNYTLLKHVYQKMVNNNFITTYIVKNDSSQLTSLFEEKTYLQFFGDFAAISDSLKKTRLTEDNIVSFAKHYDFKERYEKNERIYYSQTLDELRTPDNAAYYARIKGLNQLVWELEFFDTSNSLIFTGHFSSLFPRVKHGEFIWFYPDGSIRKKVNYKKNEIDGSVTEYFPNGKIHYVYKVPFDASEERNYSKVINIEGKDVLDGKGNGVEVIHDSINNRQITRRFISNRLNSSTFQDENKNTILQQGDYNTYIRSVTPFHRRLRKDVKFPEEAFKIYKQGLVLIRFLVDNNGNIKSYNIIKGMGNQFDNQLLTFLGSANSRLKWNIPRFNNQPCFQEIVVPFTFEIQKIQHVNVYYHNNNWMWQQQNMMRTIPPPKMVVPTYNFR